MITRAELRDTNHLWVATKKCVITAIWKCGIIQTTALNLPGMLYSVHWDEGTNFDGVGRIIV